MSQDRMTDRPLDAFEDAALEAMFAEARLAEPAPLADDLRTRLRADALAAVAPVAVRRGWLARLGSLLADLGGVPGLAGVSAAGVAGVWIGFAAPGVTAEYVTQFWQGAATVSPTVSTWIDLGPLAADGTDLVSLMSSEGE